MFDIFQLIPFLSTAVFASGIFIAWNTGLSLFVREIRITHRVEPSGNVILMIFDLSLCCARSRKLVSFAFVSVHCFAFFFRCL